MPLGYFSPFMILYFFLQNVSLLFKFDNLFVNKALSTMLNINTEKSTDHTPIKRHPMPAEINPNVAHVHDVYVIIKGA